MAPILIEPLSEQAYELLRQLEALHVLRVVQPPESPVALAPRKWAGAATSSSPISTEAWHQHIEELRNEWERNI